MPDAEGHPIEGEEGYEAYLESVTNPNTDNGASGEQKQAKEKTRLSAQVRMPLELYTQVEDAAKAADKTNGRFILELVAKHFKFTLPAPTAKGKKYASEEERKAAAKERRDERKDLVKMLLAKYEAEQAAEAAAKEGAAA